MFANLYLLGEKLCACPKFMKYVTTEVTRALLIDDSDYWEARDILTQERIMANDDLLGRFAEVAAKATRKTGWFPPDDDRFIAWMMEEERFKVNFTICILKYQKELALRQHASLLRNMRADEEKRAAEIEGSGIDYEVNNYDEVLSKTQKRLSLLGLGL